MAKRDAPNGPPPDSFERLILELEKLPGVGRRSAERMAYHLLGQPLEEAMRLAYAIRDVKKNLRPCPRCGDLTEAAECAICADPRREEGLICVVEWPREVRAVEKSAEFRGRYHVLMGRISPLNGVEPHDLRIESLLQRVRQGEARELLLATSPTLEGDVTANFIAAQARLAAEKMGKPVPRCTRLARGLPAGSELSFAQAGTIGDALKGRKEF